MKITPLEVRQKSFEKVFRGYDKDEVQAFLNTLSQEWEKMLDEVKELRIKLESSEREVEKLREVENSLFKTLKTAEDTGANMIQQANKAAELQLKETQMKSEKIMRESQNKARSIIEGAEKRARDIISDMMDEMRILEQTYSQILSAKENLISELKNFAAETIDKVDGYKARKPKFNLDKHISAARELSMSLNEFYVSNDDSSEEAEQESADVPEEETKKEKPKNDLSIASSEKSFFDSIE
ncbi:MAG: DivIVA domain-containing protein [Cyclobacteriaceae bacterium]|nr:DivIVA domain-containing protein [Cyclobacteriaceae bacterium]